MIDLNSNEYDVKEVSIFNDGEPGAVENVKISKIEKKTTDDSTPDWKIFFKDANDKEINFGFYYVDINRNEWAPKKWKTQATLLKHLVNAIIGEGTKLPKFETTEEALDKIMGKLSKEFKPSATYRIFTNYGTTNKPSKYISVRGFAPMIESMSVPASESRLTKGGVDRMTRLEADSESEVGTSTAVAEAPATDEKDW